MGHPLQADQLQGGLQEAVQWKKVQLDTISRTCRYVTLRAIF